MTSTSGFCFLHVIDSFSVCSCRIRCFPGTTSGLIMSGLICWGKEPFALNRIAPNKNESQSIFVISYYMTYTLPRVKRVAVTFVLSLGEFFILL